jgi:radical SAM protein with 4Fe4S-binding SPASM domain
MRLAPPTHLWLATTGRCNLRCRHCAFLLKGDSPAAKDRDLNPEVFEKLRTSVCPSLKTVMIGGNDFGEPLFARDWDRMFDQLCEHAVKPYLVTNGTLFNEKRLEALLRKDSSLFISTEAATEDTYRRFRGTSFQRVKKQVRTAVELRARLQSQSQIRFNFAAMISNLREVILLIRTAAELGMDGVNLMHFVPFREEQRFLSLYYHQNDSNRVFDEARGLAQKLRIDLSCPDNFPSPSWSASVEVDPQSRRRSPPAPCHHPWASVSVDAEGNVRPCCVTSVTMGNLNESSFREIWEGRKYQRLRARVNSAHPPVYCRSCQIRGKRDIFHSSYNDPAVILSVIGPDRSVDTRLLILRRIQARLGGTEVGSRILSAALRVYRKSL